LPFPHILHVRQKKRAHLFSFPLAAVKYRVIGLIILQGFGE
jgi:hypothetical protein